MREKIFLEFNARMTQQQYNLACRFYGDMSYSYTKLVIEIFKTLLKG